jgi:hypothetical protein
MKFVFYQLVFDEEELYSMFKDFYLSFIPNYTIGRPELMSLIELMASGAEYLGRDALEKKVFPIMGVHKQMDLDIGGISILNKDSCLKGH